MTQGVSGDSPAQDTLLSHLDNVSRGLSTLPALPPYPTVQASILHTSQGSVSGVIILGPPIAPFLLRSTEPTVSGSWPLLFHALLFPSFSLSQTCGFGPRMHHTSSYLWVFARAVPPSWNALCFLSTPPHATAVRFHLMCHFLQEDHPDHPEALAPPLYICRSCPWCDRPHPLDPLILAHQK